MGVDIYLKWKGQTDKDIKKQTDSGWKNNGKVGYLRSAYNPSSTIAWLEALFDADIKREFTTAKTLDNWTQFKDLWIAREFALQNNTIKPNKDKLFTTIKKNQALSFAIALAGTMKQDGTEVLPDSINWKQQRLYLLTWCQEARKFCEFAIKQILADKKENATAEVEYSD